MEKEKKTTSELNYFKVINTDKTKKKMDFSLGYLSAVRYTAKDKNDLNITLYTQSVY